MLCLAGDTGDVGVVFYVIEWVHAKGIGWRRKWPRSVSWRIRRATCLSNTARLSATFAPSSVRAVGGRSAPVLEPGDSARRLDIGTASGTDTSATHSGATMSAER